MAKAEKVTEAGLVEVWAMFWPKKNHDDNAGAAVEWLAQERFKAFVGGFEAGSNAALADLPKGEWVISKEDILNREAKR